MSLKRLVKAVATELLTGQVRERSTDQDYVIGFTTHGAKLLAHVTSGNVHYGTWEVTFKSTETPH